MEKIAIRSVFQGLGKIRAPRDIQAGRNRTTRSLYAVVAHTENGEKILMMEPQISFAAKNIHETLVSHGIDCPSSRPQTYAVVSGKVVEEIKKEIVTYFYMGADTETGDVVFRNGIITAGAFYCCNEDGLVALADGSFRLIDLGSGGKRTHVVSARYIERGKIHGSSNAIDKKVFDDLSELFGRDIVAALTLLFVRKRISPRMFAQNGSPFSVPVLFVRGQAGAGETTFVRFLSETVFGIEDGLNASGSTFAALRNRICVNRLPIHIEEAHQQGNPVSLHQGSVADMTRKAYSGGDFSHSNETFCPEGFLIFDGISTDLFNADIGERIYPIDIPKISQSAQSAQLRQRVDAQKIELRLAIQRKDVIWSQDPNSWRESFFYNLELAQNELAERFHVSGRAAWPAILIAGAKMLGADFALEQLAREIAHETVESQKQKCFPLTTEFLTRLCSARELRKVKFVCGTDDLGHVHVDSPKKAIVKLNLNSTVAFLRASDMNASNFVASHLLRELGIPPGKDNDPTFSSFTWVRRNRDEQSKTPGGARFLQFDLPDSSMPAELQELLIRLAAPAWPDDYVDVQYSAQLSKQSNVAEVPK